jgi:hypothetical protein
VAWNPNSRWRPEDGDTLTSIVTRRNPSLATVARRAGHSTISAAEREELRGVLADEMTEFGLDDSSEPNELGLRCEELIDKLWYVSQHD